MVLLGGKVIPITAARRNRVLDARDRLVEAYCDSPENTRQGTNLVRPIAERIHKHLPPSFDLADLIGVGALALLHSATRYRPQSHNGTPFSAYARPRIRGAILDSVRRRHWANSTMEDVAKFEEKPRGTSEGGGSARGNRTPQRIPAALRIEPAIDISIDAQRLNKRVAEAISTLSPLRSTILSLYYSPELPSLLKIAQALGITEARAGQERTVAIAEVQAWLRRANVA